MLITHATVVTWTEPNQVLEDHAVLLRDGVIAEIGPSAAMSERYAKEEQVDAKDKMLMPGLICAHTHFYGAYARGLAIPGPAPKDFPEILARLWWPLDRALDEDSVRSSADMCLIDAIRHGATTLIDHHASPNAIAGSLDWIAQRVEQSGLRAALCYEVTDRNNTSGAKAGIEENLRFIKRIQSGENANGRLAALFGLHASLTLSDATLRACREACPEEIGFHIHVAEHEADEYDSLARSGIRAVDRLEALGILGPNTIVAHGIHVDAREIAILAQTGTWLSHQPRSNMNNAVGAAAVEAMLRAGIPVCIGTDGFSHTMWTEWKTAYLLQKVVHRDPRRMDGAAVAQMGTVNNARLASRLFNQPIGQIAPGAAADLILVDYQPFTPLTAGNLPWHILFGFQDSMVSDTMVAGRWLMRNREILSLDAHGLTSRAMRLASGVWQRYTQQMERTQPL